MVIVHRTFNFHHLVGIFAVKDILQLVYTTIWKDFIVLLTYVDDIIIVANNMRTIDKTDISDEWKTQDQGSWET